MAPPAVPPPPVVARFLPEGPAWAAELRQNIVSTWNVGSLSTTAAETTVTLAVELSPEGHILSTRLVQTSTANETATKQAYEAAKRALHRGLMRSHLPAAEYAAWHQLLLTFDPVTGVLR